MKKDLKKRIIVFNESKGIGIKRLISKGETTLKLWDEVTIKGEKYLVTGVGTIK